jgi:hypothetical protein
VLERIFAWLTTRRPHILSINTQAAFSCLNILFHNFRVYNARIMIDSPWETQSQYAMDEEFRPMSKRFIMGIVEQLSPEMTFWDRLAKLSQEAHDDKNYTYRVPKGFHMPTSESVREQQERFNVPNPPRKRAKPPLVAVDSEISGQHNAEHRASVSAIEQTS